MLYARASHFIQSSADELLQSTDFLEPQIAFEFCAELSRGGQDVLDQDIVTSRVWSSSRSWILLDVTSSMQQDISLVSPFHLSQQYRAKGHKTVSQTIPRT